MLPESNSKSKELEIDLKSLFEQEKVFPWLVLSLTHFWPMFPFYTPWKHQKTKGFLVFSRDIKGNIGKKCID